MRLFNLLLDYVIIPVAYVLFEATGWDPICKNKWCMTDEEIHRQ